MTTQWLAFRLHGFFALLLLAASIVTAAEVELTVTTIVPETTKGEVTGFLTAKPFVRNHVEADPPKEVVVQIRVPGQTTLQLQDGVIWALHLEASGYWVPTAYVEAGEGDGAVLQLYATGQLRGSFVIEGREPLPTELDVRFQAEAGREPLEGHVACLVEELSLEKQNWFCEIPVGKFDLRLRAAGFISHYLWQREIFAEKIVEVPMIRLKRGASVVGWVEVEGSAPLDEKPARATLTPLPTQISDPREKDQETRFSLSTRVSPRGFLQLAGVAPGSYVLVVEQPDMASARVRPVVVEKNDETEIDDPIVLRRPLDLEIQIEPPVDTQAGSWMVEIHPAESLIGAIARGRTDEEGLWRQSRQSVGDYNVAILDSRGSRVAYQLISLTPEQTQFHIDLPIIWVEGRVTLGDEPLSASLAFGGFKKFVSLQFESDENGEFSGYVPRPGLWRIDVKSKNPKVHRRLRDVEVEASPQGAEAWLEIELPDTVLEGKTIDESGRPFANAQVMVVPYSEGEDLSHATSNEDGEFKFRGFEPGSFKIEALGMGSKRLRSDPVDIEMDKGTKQQFVQLIMRETSALRGTVRSPAGPVLGAQIQAQLIEKGQAGMMIPSGRSGVRGEFSLEVPGLPGEIDIKVLAPGFTLQRFRTLADPSEPLEIVVDQQGGALTLMLGASPEVTPFGGLDLQVHHRGFWYHYSELSRWAFINGAYKKPGEAHQIPMVPAGYWTVCSGSTYAKNVLGKPGREAEVLHSKCETGFLAPAGELVLHVPWPVTVDEL